MVVRTNVDVKNFNDMKTKYEHLLKIPRRPPRHTYETAEELHSLENEMFLTWRLGLSHLEDVSGKLLVNAYALESTPVEENEKIFCRWMA